MNRKILKQNAKITVKKHYILLTIICVLSALIGSEFISSLALFKTNSSAFLNSVNVKSNSIYRIIEGNKKLSEFTASTFGKSRGVFAQIANGALSQSILTRLTNTVNSIIHSKSALDIVLIVLGFLIIFIGWMCIVNTFSICLRRLFLESRTYTNVSLQRIAFLHNSGYWWRVSLTMMLRKIYQYLWCLTIVGGIIKYYSYFLVPFILAENPSIKPNKAITLSRRMMKGYKWKFFIYQLTFIGWNLLGLVTFGLSDIFFSNSYITSFYCECYKEIRNKSKNENIADSDLLNDEYLFTVADDEILGETYKQAKTVQKPVYPFKGIKGFFANVFGVVLKYDVNELEFEEKQTQYLKEEKTINERNGKSYPIILFPYKKYNKQRDIREIHYLRHYSVTTIILLFFVFSFIGWIWEVSLHLVVEGGFVNRGSMFGPWLPIYGNGGLMILILLNKFRKNPVKEFIAAIILCGFVEYFTSYFMELRTGLRWWDYTGYFLNINGRICAEGLLVFGIGGIAVVYLLVPRLDLLFRKLKYKTIVILSVCLLTLFSIDTVYSHFNPNEGEGVTDYEEVINQSDSNK